MRKSKRIAQLELQVAYLSQYVDIISDSLLELLQKEDERAGKEKNIESGKWYKNP